MATEAGVAYVTVAYDPASLNRLRATTQQETTRASGAFSRIGRAATTAFAFGAGAAFVVGVGKAISSAADFQKQLNILQAVSHATGDEMKRAGDLALELGADVRLPATSATDAANAMTELAKGGLSVQQAMKAARGTLELAAAGQVDVGTAAQATAGALNQFALNGGQAVHVADLLAGAANASAGDVNDFAEGLQYAGTAAHAAGQSIDLTVAALAEMANAGISGSVAGSSLAQALRALQAPSAKAKDEIKQLGLNVYDAAGNMKPLDEVAQIFSSHLGDLTQKQQNQALATIFGSRAVQAARVVFLGGAGALDKYRDRVSKQGNAQRLAEAQTKGFSGALQGLQSTLETLGVQIGLKVLPALTSVTQSLSSNLPGAVNTAEGAVENLSGPVGVLSENFGTIAPLIEGTVAALVTLKVASIGASVATGAYGAAVATLNTAELLLTSGTRSLALAQTLQGNAAAIAATEQAASAAATESAAGMIAIYQAAVAGTIPLQTASAAGAGAMAIAETAQGDAAAAAAAEVGVLNAAMLATPWGLAAVGVAAVVGLAVAFHQLRSETDPLKGTFNTAAEAVDRMTGALNRERDAAQNLAHDELDLRGSNLAVQQAQSRRAQTTAELAAQQQKVNQLDREGKRGTSEYAQAVKDLHQKQLDQKEALLGVDRAQQDVLDNQGRLRKDLGKDRAATEAATASTKTLAGSFKTLLTRSHQVSQSVTVTGTKFGSYKTVSAAAARSTSDFAHDMVGLNSKVTAAIPKLQRTADEAQQVANRFGDSQSAAARAARAYAFNARSALLAAFKLQHLTTVAGDLARALDAIPSQKTIDIYTTTHTSDRRQRRAAGGPVTAGTPYVVGEVRPELFIPETNGFIMPQVPTSGGDTVIVIDGRVLQEHIDYRVERREKRQARRLTARGAH